MVFNAIFNNISVISWRSVLLVEEICVPGENHHPDSSRWQTLSHKVVSSTPRLSGIRIHNETALCNIIYMNISVLIQNFKHLPHISLTFRLITVLKSKSILIYGVNSSWPEKYVMSRSHD
jgi:hypothetical protein